MTLSAFDAPGRFFRGNLHTHSDASDGACSPAEVAATYREAGYDFLCLSDHFLPAYGFPVTDTLAFRTNRFTTILGAEVHAPANSHGEAWHILAVGLPADFPPTTDGEDGVALARRARQAGAFVGIAHPQWSGLTVEDGRALASVAHAVEIYNTGCDGECARPDGCYLLDALLNEGRRLFAYAADDAHFRWPDTGGGWVMVKAETNEPDLLVEALKLGAFYSSQGPELHAVSVEGETVRVACSAVVNVAVVGRGSRAVHRRGDGLTGAELPLERFAGDWLRIVVTDSEGRKAWSNPIWP